MPAKISFTKFAEILKSNGYSPVMIHYMRNEDGDKVAVFIECKLPKIQKNILVNINSKYSMKIPSDVNIKSNEIVKISENLNILTEKSINYLIDIRGPLIESDLAAISAEGICHSKFNGEVYCYMFASSIKDSIIDSGEEEDEIEEKEDEIEKLEEQLIKLSKQLKEKGMNVPKKTKIDKKVVVDIKGNEINKNNNINEENETQDGNNNDNKMDKNDPLVAVKDGENTDNSEEKEEEVIVVEGEDGEEVIEYASDVEAEENNENKTQNEENRNNVEQSQAVELVFDKSHLKKDKKKHLQKDKHKKEKSSSSNTDELLSSIEEKKHKKHKHSKKHKYEKHRKEKNYEHEKYYENHEHTTYKKKKAFDKIPTLKVAHRSNYITSFDELDVNLGIIYVVIDISNFYNKISTYELEALELYEQIDDNEKDMRLKRVKKIKSLFEEAIKHLDTKIEDIQADEKGMKYQLLRLTAVLQDSENMRKKLNPEMDATLLVTSQSVMEVERIYNDTRKTIHEINLSVLHKRDEVEDLLVNYEETMKELIDI